MSTHEPDTDDVVYFGNLFEKSLNELKALFEALPNLSPLLESAPKVRFRAPELRITEEVRHSRPRTRLETYFRNAARNYHFLNTALDEWRTFVKFPNDHARVDFGTSNEAYAHDSINVTRDAAERWIESEMVEFMRADGDPGTIFALGEPGSGKTTLFKYLLNMKRASLLRNRTICSRFEAVKFFRRCTHAANDSALVTALLSYLREILVRDIVFSLGYKHDDDGRRERARGPSAPFADVRACENLISEIAPDKRQLGTFTVTDYVSIDQSLKGVHFDKGPLRDIAPDIQDALIRHFSKQFRYCIIFDGLDIVSLADDVLDSVKMRVLNILVSTFGLGGMPNSAYPNVYLGVNVDSVFVLRTNTYARTFVMERTPLTPTRYRVEYVSPIPNGVAFLSLVQRCVHDMSQLHRNLSGKEKLDVEHAIEQSIGNLVDALNFRLDLQHPTCKSNSLDVFRGNIRDFFRFLGQTVAWLMSEMLPTTRKGSFAVESLVEEARLLSSEKAFDVTRRRSYRLLEFLLLSDGLRFHNAVEVRSGVLERVVLGTRGPRGLRKNPAFRGFVDNIFDYHRSAYREAGESFYLLEKIRLVQILGRMGKLNSDALGATMADEFGYFYERDAERLPNTVRLLINDGLCDVDIDDGNLLLSLTRKGRLVVPFLMANQGYLEHVFHNTLIPEVLITFRYDRPRGADPRAWTIASLRNIYVLLSYIKFVEGRSARGVRVAEEFKVLGPLLSKSIDVVERICWEDFRAALTEHTNNRQSMEPTQWIVKQVSKEIKAVRDSWSTKSTQMADT